MARMHLAKPNDENLNLNGAYGFPVDNTIGGTSQESMD